MGGRAVDDADAGLVRVQLDVEALAQGVDHPLIIVAEDFIRFGFAVPARVEVGRQEVLVIVGAVDGGLGCQWCVHDVDIDRARRVDQVLCYRSRIISRMESRTAGILLMTSSFLIRRIQIPHSQRTRSRSLSYSD